MISLDSATPRELSELGNRAVMLAEKLLRDAINEQSSEEKRQARSLARLMEDPVGKAFTFAMVDQVFRSRLPAVRARRWRRLLADRGVPEAYRGLDEWLMRLGAAGSELLPSMVMWGVEEKMRRDSARVILPGETERLHRYLRERREQGFRINLNHLGEAVLGEEEAAHRLAAVLGHLGDPAVPYVSVKISAIFSQINLTAWRETLEAIKERLRRLYHVALAAGKFVNLDMEEYRDLELTLTAFREVLDEEEFLPLSAGMVLQAYLPDSWPAQQALTEWARRRLERGGVPIKLRLVKGANLAMENVEAELRGWHAAPYGTKAETDANFRRMLESGCRPENARAVRLGVASHNLFDVALALTLRENFGTADLVELEMLEGMANHQARTVRDAAGGLLLYAPAVRRDDFLSAMAYLMRRLDENTAPGNFLRDLFAMEPGAPAWEKQRAAFLTGWEQRHAAGGDSRRALAPSPARGIFHNEPDTDWARRDLREAWEAAREGLSDELLPEPEPLEAMITEAVAAQEKWAALALEERARVLRRAAEVMAGQRFQTLALMLAEGKKAAPEADAEVSEAIDFARYYADHAAVPEGVKAAPLGLTVVAPPWNFPYAIPCGGAVAALMAGNAVILKPAPETRRIACALARQLWQAGVPRSVLHFYPCADGASGRALILHPSVACVVLTGAYETARLFLKWRPSLRLLAETSGKNALIITAQADRELAIRDLVKSAFGHSGQKCSAASLAIVEAEVYDDEKFRRQLRDAAASLPVGPAPVPTSVITPLIREPGDALHRGLIGLDEGEEWLLQPEQDEHDPCLWSPGIRLGVKPGTWFHRTECFGPVLGLMRAGALEEAVAWQNATAYGLTAGLHSLDDEEIRYWKSRVQAGNLYVNRPTTGAIVRRQPFGGWKRSCIGPGAKAGGPNYVWSFLHLSDSGEASDSSVEEGYRLAWETHFSLEHDPSALRAESNVFRYRPARGVILRLEGEDEKTLHRARLASALTGTPLVISRKSDETDEAFARRLEMLGPRAEFLRTVGPCPEVVLEAAHESGLNWIPAPFTACGRVELRYWLREQSVTQTLHRYGQLPDEGVP